MSIWRCSSVFQRSWASWSSSVVGSKTKSFPQPAVASQPGTQHQTACSSWQINPQHTQQQALPCYAKRTEVREKDTDKYRCWQPMWSWCKQYQGDWQRNTGSHLHHCCAQLSAPSTDAQSLFYYTPYHMIWYNTIKYVKKKYDLFWRYKDAKNFKYIKAARKARIEIRRARRR